MISSRVTLWKPNVNEQTDGWTDTPRDDYKIIGGDKKCILFVMQGKFTFQSTKMMANL